MTDLRQLLGLLRPPPEIAGAVSMAWYTCRCPSPQIRPAYAAKSAADSYDARTAALPTPVGETFSLAPPQPTARPTTTIASSHRYI
jgi:hypothetical protein